MFSLEAIDAWAEQQADTAPVLTPERRAEIEALIRTVMETA